MRTTITYLLTGLLCTAGLFIKAQDTLMLSHRYKQKEVTLKHAANLSFRLKDGSRYTSPGSYSLTDTSLVWHNAKTDSVVRVLRFADIDRIKTYRFHNPLWALPFIYIGAAMSAGFIFVPVAALSDGPDQALELAKDCFVGQLCTLPVVAVAFSKKTYKLDDTWKIKH